MVEDYRWKEKTQIVFFRSVPNVAKVIYCLFHIRKTSLKSGDVLNVGTRLRKDNYR